MSYSIQFGLEVQHPFSDYIMNQSKTIETRKYPLPYYLMNEKCLIIESKEGKAGVSSLNDIINEKDEDVKVLGYVIFSDSFMYESFEHFDNERHLHLVTKDSLYDYKTNEVIYGWRIKEVYNVRMDVQEMKRKFRSIFELTTTKIIV